MGSEAAEMSEEENISTLKLPLLNTIPLPARSPDRSGMHTPPLHTTASVPFRWEEEPGKPRPCTALIPADPKNHKLCLELPVPPRLQTVEYSSKLTKMPSPTTVLDGPYIFHSSSFRFRRDHHQLPRRRGSFSFGSSGGGSPERGLLSAILLSNSSSRTPEEGKERRGGFFGSWGSSSGKLKKGRRREGSFDLSCAGELALEGSFGGEQSSSSSSSNSSSSDSNASAAGGGAARVKKMPRFTRNGSFSNLSHVRSHFWATIFEGFKQVLPWKSSRK